MQYRAVGSRCAVDIGSLELPLSDKEVLSVLVGKGFTQVNVNLVSVARSCVGTSAYVRGARPSMAPAVVDCSSFTKWLYGRRGIWLPRRSIQQRELGDVVEYKDILAGDLIFVSGFIDYYHNDPADGVGHVGIATETGTVIHAANRIAGVTETPLEEFTEGKFRGVRRYVPSGRTVLTLETPLSREVETSDDMRWIVMQSLPSGMITL